MLPNIILIILDTLRKDYGEKCLNQILQKFGFVYYSNAITPSPWTIPAHVSIFTGKYPIIHRTHETSKLKIPNIKIKSPLSEFLPVKLSSSGYYTVLISANTLIQPIFGFKGFQENYDIFWSPPQRLSCSNLEIIRKYSSSRRPTYLMTALNLLRHKKWGILWNAALDIFWNKRILPSLKRYPLEKGVTKAISILKAMDLTDKNFIFINLMEVHEPYSMKYPSPGGIVLTLTNQVTDNMIMDWKKGYEKETNYLRDKLKTLLETLKQKINFDDSLIIITSDHGQLLGEDNRIGHGAFLDDELIRVPLWIKYPEYIDTPIKDKNVAEYISLTQLYNSIVHSTEGKLQPITSTNLAFSESYGSPNYIPKEKLSKETEIKLKELEKHRIAIYYKNFKGIFNVIDLKFEEIRSYDPKIEITEDIVKHVKKEMVKFLKTAIIAKIPKIKI